MEMSKINFNLQFCSDEITWFPMHKAICLLEHEAQKEKDDVELNSKISQIEKSLTELEKMFQG